MPETELRLLSKREVVERIGVSYPTIWRWMRAGTFPRGLAVGERTMWRSDDIAGWLANLQQRRLKGDRSTPANVGLKITQ
jgi:predicted DNA-binding transcriptional regulator AlpA